MSNTSESRKGLSEADLQDLVAQADTGGRTPAGPVGLLLLVTAVTWSLFQLWYASPLPFMLNFAILGRTLCRLGARVQKSP